MSRNWQNDTAQALSVVEEVTCRQLAELLATNEVIVVDVREGGEQAQGIIGQAIALPMSEFDRRAEVCLTKISQPVVYYCGGGVRSAVASMWADKQGLPKGYSLQGGFKAWQHFHCR